MTYLQNETLTCPKCDHEEKVGILDTINVTLNPGLREDLFSGKINVSECSSCGLKADLPRQLLYHDMGLKIAVQYFPANFLEEDEFCQQFNPESLTRNDDLNWSQRIGCRDTCTTRTSYSIWMK